VSTTEAKESNERIRAVAPQDRRATPGPGGFGIPTERSDDFRGAVRRLWSLLTPERPRLLLIAVLAVVSTALNVAGPKVLGEATDVVVAGVSSGRGIDFGDLHTTLLLVGLVYAVAAGLGVLIACVLAGVVQRLMFRLRSLAEAKLNALPLAYIDRQARGDLLSRVTNDIDNVAQSLQQTLSQMLTSVLLLTGVAAAMFFISPLLAVVALTTVPASVWIMRLIASRARPRYLSQWRSTGALNAHIEETFTGHAIVKSFGRQAEEEARFRRTNDELFESSFGAQFMSSLMQPATMFMGNLQYVIVAVVGGLRVASGAISVGAV
jgi:ATP-binding cassette, subfamily B, multidrug efflux pump